MAKTLFSRRLLVPVLLAALGLPLSGAIGDAPRGDKGLVEAGLSQATPDVSDTSAQPKPSRHEIRRSADGFFYVFAVVNGVSTRFLVDTGANVAVLTASDARRIGVRADSSDRNQKLETAGGTVPMAWTRLDEISVAGHEFHGTQAVIVREGAGVSLIGQDMLSKFHTINVEGNRMILL